MTEINLAQYNSQNRHRKSRENGSVKLVGKRQKKWEGTYHVTVNGVRHTRRRIIGTKAEISTKTEALDQLRTWIRRQAEEPVADSGKRTMAELADDYLAVKKSGWTRQTMTTIRSLMEHVIKPTIGEIPIRDVNPEHCKQLIDNLPQRKKLRRRDSTGVSISYAKKTIEHLRGMLALAEERDLIQKNPARSIATPLKMPRQATRPDKTVFPPKYLPALLGELKLEHQLVVRISLLGATRPGELFALTGADIGPGWIHVANAFDRYGNRGPTKTDRPHFVHIPPELNRDLSTWIAANEIGPTELVFPNQRGGPMHRQCFLDRHLRPAAKRAKIPVESIDFQMLRRSFATLTQLVGMDVKSIQAQLGHTTPDMTASVYMQSIDSVTREQMTRFEDMLAGRVPIPVDIEERLGKVTIQ